MADERPADKHALYRATSDRDSCPWVRKSCIFGVLWILTERRKMHTMLIFYENELGYELIKA